MPEVEQSSFDVVRGVANVVAVIAVLFAVATLVPACAYNPALAVATLFFPWLSLLDVCFAMAVAFAIGFGVRNSLSGRHDANANTDATAAVGAVARLVWIVALLPPWLGSTSMVDHAEWGRSVELTAGWGALVLAAALLTSAHRAPHRLVSALSGVATLVVVVASFFLATAYGASWILAPGLAVASVPLSLSLVALGRARADSGSERS